MQLLINQVSFTIPCAIICIFSIIHGVFHNKMIYLVITGTFGWQLVSELFSVGFSDLSILQNDQMCGTFRLLMYFHQSVKVEFRLVLLK